LGMPAGSAVELVHHVFRPDGSPQRLRTGEQLPLHATAVGKCLLALAPIAVPRPHELDLQRYTAPAVGRAAAQRGAGDLGGAGGYPVSELASEPMSQRPREAPIERSEGV